MANTKPEKNNKVGICIGIAVAIIAVVAIVVAIVLANKNNNGSTGENSGNTSQVVDSNPDAVIQFGEYDAMAQLASEIQNGQATGKTVKIEGIVSHPMTTYSVVQENADGTKKIGTEFIIKGAAENEYPKDGDRILITGRVIEKQPMYFVIETTPDSIGIISKSSN